LFKCASQECVIRFFRFSNNKWDGEEHPESWPKAIIIPVYKKENIKHCENYTGIVLLNSGFKIYSNIIRKKITHLLQK
jgi:hypothetical protein